jgi:hypothetical protein
MTNSVAREDTYRWGRNVRTKHKGQNVDSGRKKQKRGGGDKEEKKKRKNTARHLWLEAWGALPFSATCGRSTVGLVLLCLDLTKKQTPTKK